MFLFATKKERTKGLYYVIKMKISSKPKISISASLNNTKERMRLINKD